MDAEGCLWVRGKRLLLLMAQHSSKMQVCYVPCAPCVLSYGAVWSHLSGCCLPSWFVSKLRNINLGNSYLLKDLLGNLPNVCPKLTLLSWVAIKSAICPTWRKNAYFCTWECSSEKCRGAISLLIKCVEMQETNGNDLSTLSKL